MPEFLRGFCDRAAAAVNPAGPIHFVASVEGVKRDGKELKVADWRLDNFRANPVVLFGHDYLGHRLPIGRADVEVDGKRLMAAVTFDPDDQFAQEVRRKYVNGFLNAVSVGWDEFEDGTNDLLDISAVPVPGDPDALMARQKRSIAAMINELSTLMDPEPSDQPPSDDPLPDHRGAIPPHTTGKAPLDTPWNGSRELAAAEGKTQLRRMSAWVDDDADPDTKRAYKLPHHEAASGDVVWRGVAAAMSRLLQATTQIPDADRRGAYNHLKRHYQQFDRTPPEFRTNAELAALGADELRGLFLEGEPELAPEVFAGLDTTLAAAMLARHYDALEQVITTLQGVSNYAKTLADDEAARHANDAAATLKALFGGNL